MGPERWRAWIHANTPHGVSLSEYLDEPRGTYRAAGFAEGRLAFCLFVGPASQRPQWDIAKALLAAETLEERQRRFLLSGQSADGMADAGPIVCACFGVGMNVIRGALASGEATDVAGIGRALRAGTNCGSCLPELKRIVAHDSNHESPARQPAHTR
jgi:assimilatory nitrate reductase catalytic subunit